MSTVKRCLRGLRDQGVIVARGNGKAARYLLAEHAEDGDDDTTGDDDTD